MEEVSMDSMHKYNIIGTTGLGPWKLQGMVLTHMWREKCKNSTLNWLAFRYESLIIKCL